eukprot:768205-Hanusia_phi.AAC.3
MPISDRVKESHPTQYGSSHKSISLQHLMSKLRYRAAARSKVLQSFCYRNYEQEEQLVRSSQRFILDRKIQALQTVSLVEKNMLIAFTGNSGRKYKTTCESAWSIMIRSLLITRCLESSTHGEGAMISWVSDREVARFSVLSLTHCRTVVAFVVASVPATSTRDSAVQCVEMCGLTVTERCRAKLGQTRQCRIRPRPAARAGAGLG